MLSPICVRRASRRVVRLFPCLLAVVLFQPARAAQISPVLEVEQQPLVAATERLMEALVYVGNPLSAEDTRALKAAMAQTDATKSVTAIQKVLVKPEFRQKVKQLGMDVTPGYGPQRYTGFVSEEVQKWGGVIRGANIKPE